ncbi:MAG: ACT domain-containing protein [Acidimicrobiia bacterium]
MRDLVIHVANEPGALARVTASISDAGVNLAAATYIGTGDVADLHVLVKHAEATRRVLEPAGLAVTDEREVVVVDAEDRPGVLADLARRVGDAGVNLTLVYVATGTRIVFGADDIPALRAALGVPAEASADADAAPGRGA